MMGFQGLDIASAFVAMCCLQGLARSQYHTCDEYIDLTCAGILRIYLLDTNASTSLKTQMLFSCPRKFHWPCRVQNPDGECIVVFYNCLRGGPGLELHYLDNATTSSPGSIELLSQGYDDKNFQIAQNFQCNIKLISNQMKSLYIEVYDFSPFIDNKNYCFSVINRPEIKVCTGSGVIYHYFVTPFDIIDGRDQLNFTIGFIDGFHEFLKLRFFIKFFVGNRITMTTSCFHDSTSPLVTVITTAYNTTMSPGVISANNTTMSPGVISANNTTMSPEVISANKTTMSPGTISALSTNMNPGHSTVKITEMTSKPGSWEINTETRPSFNNTMSSDTGDQSTVNVINLPPTSQDKDSQTTLKAHAPVGDPTRSPDLQHLKIGIGVLGCLVFFGLIISMAVISCYLCKIKRETNSRQDPTDVSTTANNHELTTMNTTANDHEHLTTMNTTAPCNNHEYMYPADDHYQNITSDNTSQINLGNLTINANPLYVPTENT